MLDSISCREGLKFSLSFQVSRSIGDVYLKKPEFNRDPLFHQFGFPVPLKRAVMTAEPSIVARKLEPEDMFLIFASDGLWEHLSDEAAVGIVFKNPRVVSTCIIPSVLSHVLPCSLCDEYEITSCLHCHCRE